MENRRRRRRRVSSDVENGYLLYDLATGFEDEPETPELPRVPGQPPNHRSRAQAPKHSTGADEDAFLKMLAGAGDASGLVADILADVAAPATREPVQPDAHQPGVFDRLVAVDAAQADGSADFGVLLDVLAERADTDDQIARDVASTR